MKQIKHLKLWIGIAAIIGLLVAGMLYRQQKNGVEYVSPKYGPIVEAIYGLGKVKSDKTYDVKLAITKTIDQLYVKEGDVVTKGNKLVRLDDHLIFYAPFDGTVTLVAFNEAQSVFPQQTILRLEDLSHKYIEVSLEQQGALRVKPGQPVRVMFESVRAEQLKGSVSSIFPRNEEFLTHIDVPGLAQNILPGMTADVAIEVGKKDRALLVPLSGISNGRVRVVRDGKTIVVPLKLGDIDGNWAEVTEGDLKGSDQVIIKKH